MVLGSSKCPGPGLSGAVGHHPTPQKARGAARGLAAWGLGFPGLALPRQGGRGFTANGLSEFGGAGGPPWTRLDFPGGLGQTERADVLVCQGAGHRLGQSVVPGSGDLPFPSTHILNPQVDLGATRRPAPGRRGWSRRSFAGSRSPRWRCRRRRPRSGWDPGRDPRAWGRMTGLPDEVRPAVSSPPRDRGSEMGPTGDQLLLAGSVFPTERKRRLWAPIPVSPNSGTGA